MGSFKLDSSPRWAQAAAGPRKSETHPPLPRGGWFLLFPWICRSEMMPVEPVVEPTWHRHCATTFCPGLLRDEGTPEAEARATSPEVSAGPAAPDRGPARPLCPAGDGEASRHRCLFPSGPAPWEGLSPLTALPSPHRTWHLCWDPDTGTRTSLAGLIRPGCITRSLMAFRVIGKGRGAESLPSFQERLPAAKFKSIVTRKAAPLCGKPLPEKPLGCRTVLPLPPSRPTNGCPEACLSPT